MLYGEIITECFDALAQENTMEPFWRVYMVEKKTAHIKSLDEATNYCRNCLRNMINMCVRAIDSLPKEFLELGRLTQLDSCYKVFEATVILNSNNRLCAFAHRVYSEYCYDYGRLQEPHSSTQKSWMDFSIASARIAHELFNPSIDYAVNFCTRRLQIQYIYSPTVTREIKNVLLRYLHIDGSQEPYYKYLIQKDFTNCAEQTEDCKKSVKMLLSYLRTMDIYRRSNKYFQLQEEEEDDELIISQAWIIQKNFAVYFKYLEQYDLAKYAKKSDWRTDGSIPDGVCSWTPG